MAIIHFPIYEVNLNDICAHLTFARAFGGNELYRISVKINQILGLTFKRYDSIEFIVHLITEISDWNFIEKIFNNKIER